MKKYRFLTPAILEVEAAANVYEVNRSELGREFLDEVDATVQRIVQYPRTWKVLDGQIRRCRLRRFPCGIVGSKTGRIAQSLVQQRSISQRLVTGQQLIHYCQEA